MAEWIGLANGQWTTVWQSGLALPVVNGDPGYGLLNSLAAVGSDVDNGVLIPCADILLWRYRGDCVGRRLSCANGQGLARRCP